MNDVSRDHLVKKQKLVERRTMLRMELQVQATAAIALVLWGLTAINSESSRVVCALSGRLSNIIGDTDDENGV